MLHVYYFKVIIIRIPYLEYLSLQSSSLLLYLDLYFSHCTHYHQVPLFLVFTQFLLYIVLNFYMNFTFININITVIKKGDFRYVF